jgi:hypothetical protein
MNLNSAPKLESVMKRNPLNHEVHLLAELAHELANFGSGKKINLKHTYVASTYLSSCFAYDIVDGKAYMGIPDELFDVFLKIRWYVVHFIRNTPGIFLVFDMGNKPNNHPVSIRFFLRRSRVNSLLNFKKIRLVRMNSMGEASLNSLDDFFDLDVREVDRLEWEYVKK